MNVKEFKNNPSQVLFWVISGPICAVMVLITIIIISWGRPGAVAFRKKAIQGLMGIFTKKKKGDTESQCTPTAGVFGSASTGSAPGNLIAKLTSAIRRGVAVAILIGRWRDRGTREATETPNDQALSVV